MSENEARAKSRYCGKRFSILGDSISTLAGYNPSGYSVFFAGEVCARANVFNARDTWWGQVISRLGGELLVNNSWSGSRVAKLRGQTTLFPSGCSDERTGGLHRGGTMPDVIIVYLGTNDWAQGIEAKCLDCADWQHRAWSTVFDSAYERMLMKLRRNYPAAEIFCCTLCPTLISANHSFTFPESYGGVHIERYCETIRHIAEINGCRVIDLYKYRTPYDSIDGSHPNSAGMNTLASLIIKEMI